METVEEALFGGTSEQRPAHPPRLPQRNRGQHITGIAEVAEEGASRDPRGGGDLVDGDVVETPLAQQLETGPLDPQ